MTEVGLDSKVIEKELNTAIETGYDTKKSFSLEILVSEIIKVRDALFGQQDGPQKNAFYNLSARLITHDDTKVPSDVLGLSNEELKSVASRIHRYYDPARLDSGKPSHTELKLELANPEIDSHAVRGRLLNLTQMLVSDPMQGKEYIPATELSLRFQTACREFHDKLPDSPEALRRIFAHLWNNPGKEVLISHELDATSADAHSLQLWLNLFLRQNDHLPVMPKLLIRQLAKGNKPTVTKLLPAANLAIPSMKAKYEIACNIFYSTLEDKNTAVAQLFRYIWQTPNQKIGLPQLRKSHIKNLTPRSAWELHDRMSAFNNKHQELEVAPKITITGHNPTEIEYLPVVRL